MEVLIVEDDISVAKFLRQAIQEAGYSATVVTDGASALEQAQSDRYSLILLDVMIPGISGLEVCRKLRAGDGRVPVLMLTARDTLEDKVQGLDAGADDYLVKPFQMAELLARVRALVRRINAPNNVMRVGELTLNPSTRRAVRNGKNIALSATEYSLLEHLMRNAGTVLTRAAILEHVWQYDFEGNDNVLDVYISYLRGKIDRGFDTPMIHTVRGVGFRFGTEH